MAAMKREKKYNINKLRSGSTLYTCLCMSNIIINLSFIYILLHVDIISKLIAGGHQPLRPMIPSDACNTLWKELMVAAWDEIPENRPSFDKIKSMIKVINGGK